MAKTTRKKTSTNSGETAPSLSQMNTTMLRPAFDHINRLRTSITTLETEIEVEQARAEEMFAEKRIQLDEQRAELTAAIKQVTAAVQQLAVSHDIQITPLEVVEPVVQPSPDVDIIPPPVTMPPEAALPVKELATPLISNSAIFWIIVVVLAYFIFFRCDSPTPVPKPEPEPEPSPVIIVKPEPQPIVVTADRETILKEVNGSSLTYNEKLVEATRRLVVETDMDREGAYALAVENITKDVSTPEPSGISDYDGAATEPVRDLEKGGVSADTPPTFDGRAPPVTETAISAYARWLQNTLLHSMTVEKPQESEKQSENTEIEPVSPEVKPSVPKPKPKPKAPPPTHYRPRASLPYILYKILV